MGREPLRLIFKIAGGCSHELRDFVSRDLPLDGYTHIYRLVDPVNAALTPKTSNVHRVVDIVRHFKQDKNHTNEQDNGQHRFRIRADGDDFQLEKDCLLAPALPIFRDHTAGISLLFSA